MTSEPSQHPAVVALARLTVSSHGADFEVESGFAPQLVQQVGIGLSQLVASLGGHEIGAIDELSESAVMVELRGRTTRQHVVCVVEPTEPHRIALIDRQQPDWPTLDAELGPTAAWEDLVEPPPLDRWTTLPAELAAAIDHRLATARSALRTPAISAAVVLDQGLAYSAALGYADVFPITPASRRCGLRIGSITKTMTAIAVMQLVERGCFTLDTPANTLLSHTRITCAIPDASPVTVGHLLTHTAGLPRNRKGFDIAVPSGEPIPALGAFYSGEVVASRPPGEREYSNDGYGLLALIIQDVTGERFEDYLIENVLAPLAMRHTSCDDTPTTTTYRGLDVRCGVVAAAPSTRDATRGGGSVVTTIEDLARYEHLLMADGSFAGVLRPDTRSELLGVGGSPIRVFERRNALGQEITYFTGGMYGAQADIRFVTRLGVGVALFANVYNRYAGLLFARTSEQILGDVLRAQSTRT